jgi:hypothetical protein
MTDEQLIIVGQPDVCLDTDTSRCESIVQRNSAPVVVVRMTALWDDVTTEVVLPLKLECTIDVWFFPLFDDTLETAVIWWWVEASY